MRFKIVAEGVNAMRSEERGFLDYYPLSAFAELYQTGFCACHDARPYREIWRTGTWLNVLKQKVMTGLKKNSASKM